MSIFFRRAIIRFQKLKQKVLNRMFYIYMILNDIKINFEVRLPKILVSLTHVI
jgi:hypothetical protein